MNTLINFYYMYISPQKTHLKLNNHNFVGFSVIFWKTSFVKKLLKMFGHESM